jgi:predicted metal-dependent enzyme (double-stranded beta helix superfamily)
MTRIRSVVAPVTEPPAWLRTATRWLAETPDLWWPKVRRDTGERWHVPLHVDPFYEACLIGWPPGRGLDLHDHGDSCGTISVVEGSLFETYTSLSAADGARGLHHRELTTGSLVAFGPRHVHDVTNHGPGQALSIHVYAPRLRSMTFYDHVPGRGLIAVRTDLAVSETAMV